MPLRTIPRRDFLCTSTSAALAAACMGLTQKAHPAPRPNFIIFYTDDHGFGDIGCFGAEFATPKMDALAASGVRFTQWYSNSPVCSPSRASLLTGRYPQRAGVPEILGGRGSDGLPNDQLTLAEALKPLGYRTGIIGKWHLGGKEYCIPTARGFDEFYGHLGGCIDYYSHLFIWGTSTPHHDLWRNTEEIWENGTYFTHLITREAKRFLNDNKDRPFFLYVPYNAPHYPLHAPPEYFDRFPQLPAPRRHLAATVAAVDDSMGEIVSWVDTLGLRENTLIFFQSDNGPSNEVRNFLSREPDKLYLGGSAGVFRGHKASLFEGGIHVPAFLSWPGVIPAGKTIGELGAAMDIFPTFLNLAGGAVPEDYPLDGRDILAMAQGKARSPHDYLCWEYGKQRAVRNGRWKLTLNAKLDFNRAADESIFLADLNADPGESTNLADRHPDKVRELRGILAAWINDLPDEAGFYKKEP